MNPEIIIYDDERDIETLIRKASISTSLSPLKVSASPFSISSNLEKLISSERKNFDLHYLHSILVSSVWNDNDELFLASELWASRNTAKDKQFNYEHSEDDIIGHMTDSYVIDDSGSKISENTKVEDLPETVHILNQAVLYKHWMSKDKQERMDKIIEELPENKWFVSVECLLPDFDYALKDKDGKVELISRNKKTSFLTKYLKLFGGSGVYQDKRIARVPRDFIVSGKGLVKEPANKASVIIAKKLDLPNLVYSSNEHFNKKVINMDNVKELEYQAEIKKLTENYSKLQASLSEVEINKVKTELVDTKKDIESKSQEIGLLKASVEKINTEKLEVVKIVEELTKAKESLQVQLDEINKTVKEQGRLAAAKSLGLADDKALEFVKNTDKMTDEAFDKHIEFQKNFMSGNSKEKVTTTVVEISKEEVEKSKNAVEPALVINKINIKEENQKTTNSIVTYLKKNYCKVGQLKFSNAESK